MRDLKIIQLAKQNNKETAAVMEMGDDPATDNILMELWRANKKLDVNKDKIFFDHLSIGSKATAQRALQSYDEAYLLQLNMSLASVQELAKQLISLVKLYKLTPTPAWERIAGGTFNLAVMDSDLEDDDDDQVDSERVSADI